MYPLDIGLPLSERPENLQIVYLVKLKDFELFIEFLKVIYKYATCKITYEKSISLFTVTVQYEYSYEREKYGNIISLFLPDVKFAK